MDYSLERALRTSKQGFMGMPRDAAFILLLRE